MTYPDNTAQEATMNDFDSGTYIARHGIPYWLMPGHAHGYGDDGNHTTCPVTTCPWNG